MAESHSLYPAEYYSISSSSFYNKRTSNWFCNRPLSPVPSTSTDQHISEFTIQEQAITSSNIVYSNMEPLVAGNDVVDRNFDPPDSPASNNDSFLADDDVADPDYALSESDSSSELSSTSPELFCSPEGLSSPENLVQDNGNELVHEEVGAADNCPPENTNKMSSSESKKHVFCYYCEATVQNFPRHIFRNHKKELEVQKILSLPPRSKKRNELLHSLRKKGKFLISNDVTKPVRKGLDDTRYLPCTYCLGFYSTRNLWRHRKQCSENSNKGSSSGSSLAASQNLLLRHLRVDPQLKTEVFPRMRADHISLVAKKDPLICAFASRYLKINREKHLLLVASRKMRELARLLIEVKNLKPSIIDLFGALKSENYDALVAATKTVAKYDPDKQCYLSPTYALQMGTTLKQCCDIALLHIKKKSEMLQTTLSANTDAELQILIQLIEGNWRFDVSSQASKDISLQKWNKVSLVPLASDLKLLKDCLIDKANKALLKLQENNRDYEAYTILLETVYCRLLLLNRRRPGELQRLLLDTYKSSFLNQNSQGYEEFAEAISESERILMNSFKRLVIRGKRGRGVPVLFTKDVQEHLEILLKYRDFIFQTSNIYLFGNPKSSQPIIGYKVLKKYTTQCGAKNPDALTCTRLRKHLATLTQLFNMSENDMEQLASFMGHTLGIHRSSYRLPDDVYQTARISKLLILMEKGEAGQFKGKSLDDINLNLEEDLMKETDNDLEQREEILKVANEVLNENETNEVNETNELAGEEDPNSAVKKKSIGNKRVLTPWTEDQKKVVTAYFKSHIKTKRPPKKIECIDLISKNAELLKNKDWLKIKVFVQNKYKKKC